MTLLCTVLKVIGIILLVLLLLLLAVILIILFVPITYRAEGDLSDRNQKLLIHAGWLFGILGVGISWQNSLTPVYFLRIFCFRPISSDKKGKQKPVPDRTAAEKVEFSDAEERNFSDAEKQNVNDAENRKFNDAKPPDEEETEPEEMMPEGPKKEDRQTQEAENVNSAAYVPRVENASSAARSPRVENASSAAVSGLFTILTGIWKKIRAIPQKIRRILNRAEKISDHIRKLIEKKDRMIDFLEKAENQKAFSHLKRELFSLLGKLLPRKWEMQAVYAAGDADLTGRLYGLIAMFPFMYRYRWTVVPDFEGEEFFLQGNFRLKGHFSLISPLASLIRILLDQNCRSLYRQIKKVRSQRK